MKNNNFPPNLDPHAFALIAVGVGYALVGHYNINEQNSIGNWFELVGQYILTHSAQQQLIEGRIENNNININTSNYKQTGNPFTDNSQNRSNQTQRDEVDFLMDAVQKIMNELDEMRNSKD